MNSYWAEQYARQHVDQMAAEARGDGLVAGERRVSEPQEVVRLAVVRRARTRIRAFTVRQLGLAARSR